MSKSPILYDEDGSERELPWKWAVCSACEGHGKSSAYLGAYTAEDMAEAGPEFVEDYINGFYDRACERCDGSGKVKVPDYAKMSKKDRAEFALQERASAEVDAEQRAELRQLREI